MEASSYQEGEEEVNVNDSLNETANSIHFEHGDRDKEMAELNPALINFIKSELQLGINLDSLEEKFPQKFPPLVFLQPTPRIYCLPHSIILRQGDYLNELRDELDKLKDYQTRYIHQRKLLNITVHNRALLLFYNVRCLKTSEDLHKNKQMLDSRCLVDKLYQFYEKFYSKLYFRETSILIFYWAYQRDLLSQILPEQALKLLVICIFINFGYGVSNIVNSQSQNPQRIKMFKKMNTYAKINKKGDVEISGQLAAQYKQYTILEKRGFFMPSKKKYMEIKDIMPVCFPLLPINNAAQEKNMQTEVDKSIKIVLEHEREQMSICKNIFKIFKFLRNKFEKQMKLVIDFQEKLAYRHEFSDDFELEIMHPVLNTCICRLKDSNMRRLRTQIFLAFDYFNKAQPLESIYQLFQKYRH